MPADEVEQCPPPAETADPEPTLRGVYDQDGVDVTVIQWMLAKTPTERLRAVQDLIDAAIALRGRHGL